VTCGRARQILVEHLRGEVSEASLLTLDQHLAGCEPCRLERAQLQTLGALRDWQPPALSETARARIAARLAAHHADAVPVAIPRRSPRVALYTAAGALAAAAALMLTLRPHGVRTTAPSVSAAPPVAVAPQAPATPQAPVHATASPSSTVRFLDADLGYASNTRANLQLDTRTVHLESGELDVTRRAGATPLRVSTPRFVVALTQGHAVFAADSVQVLDGEVYVFSFDQKQLATVAAGQTWRPVPTVPPPATTAPRVEPVAPALPAALDRARASLARGDGAEARRTLHRALDGDTGAQDRDRAEAELFLAESWLIESDTERAIAAYRRVAARFPSLPEGESAAFAAAQVLSERGRAGEATQALDAYLRRWPEGRFAREAKERLAAVQP
jgi:hypothetical protein